jgi:hypothetical protein
LGYNNACRECSGVPCEQGQTCDATWHLGGPCHVTCRCEDGTMQCYNVSGPGREYCPGKPFGSFDGGSDAPEGSSDAKAAADSSGRDQDAGGERLPRGESCQCTLIACETGFSRHPGAAILFLLGAAVRRSFSRQRRLGASRTRRC